MLRNPGVVNSQGGGALDTVGTGVADTGGVRCGAGGFGRGLSAGVGESAWSAGTEAAGAWIETTGASDVAVCGLELDFVVIPSASAAMKATAAAAAEAGQGYAIAVFSMWMSPNSL